MAESAMAYAAPVVQHPADVRVRFMRRVYAHLMGAIAGFVLLEFFLFSTGLAYTITEFIFNGPSYNWLLILGGFAIVSWLASSVAHRATTPAAQYSAYTALIAAEALLFVPLLVFASLQAPGSITSAALLSILGFAGLSVIALTSGRDFSVLGGFLKWALIVALLLIVGSVLFGFDLGTWFSVAMIGVAGCAILYDTSKVLRTYPPDREVAASMELFASLALLFWYVLRLLSDR
jgi:FtsH-binding integral membrane protein